MDKHKRLFGICGIAGAALCAVAVATSAALQGISPFGGFAAELGIYPGRALTASPALIFNAGFMLFGLAFGAHMVFRGLEEATPARVALGFFGALTGLLAVIQAVLTLNNAFFHYIAAGAFYASVFVLCALHLVFALLGRVRKSVATLIAAGLAGLGCAVVAGFTLTGGMSRALTLAVSVARRGSFEPFALIGWAALALTLVFAILVSADALAGGEEAGGGKKTRDIEL